VVELLVDTITEGTLSSVVGNGTSNREVHRTGLGYFDARYE
jgi:hypothetical protein